MRMRQTRPKGKVIFAYGSGSFIQNLITEQANELGIKQLSKSYRLDLIKHIQEVVIITIRSELIRYDNISNSKLSCNSDLKTKPTRSGKHGWINTMFDK